MLHCDTLHYPQDESAENRVNLQKKFKAKKIKVIHYTPYKIYRKEKHSIIKAICILACKCLGFIALGDIMM